MDLWGNDITADGAQVLADAILSGQCPPRLQINIGENNVTVESMRALADAWGSEQSPPGLILMFEEGDYETLHGCRMFRGERTRIEPRMRRRN